MYKLLKESVSTYIMNIACIFKFKIGLKTEWIGFFHNTSISILYNANLLESHQTMKMMRGEVSAKTTFQRTANGPLTISEVCPEGKYISIENTTSGANRRVRATVKTRCFNKNVCDQNLWFITITYYFEQEVNMDGWKLKRTVDGKRDYIYMFRNFTLKPGKVVKVREN